MAINVCKNVEPMDMPPPLSSYIAPILGLNINKLIIFDIAPRSRFLLNDIRNNQFDTYLRKYFYLFKYSIRIFIQYLLRTLYEQCVKMASFSCSTD